MTFQKRKAISTKLIFFSPLFSFNWKERNEEYENALKDPCKSPG